MKGQEKEILIEEIMGLLSSSTGYDHHTENDSLRFSTDYDPINLTNDDQIQEIKFEFLDEDQGSEKQVSHHFKKTEAIPSNRRSQIEKDTMENGNANKKDEELRLRVKQKNSLKLGQMIKKKISEKQDVDEFTKKYDNLFESVFSHEKLRSKMKEKEQVQEVQKTGGSKYSLAKKHPVKTLEPASQFKKPLEKQVVSQEVKPLPIAKEESGEKLTKKEEQNINIKITESFLSKFDNKPLQESITTGDSPSRPRKVSDLLNDIPFERSKERRLSQSLVSNQSLKSLENSSCSIPQIVTPENFDLIAQQYSHKPYLIQALKPPIRVSYKEKKDVVVIHPTHLLPPQNQQITSTQSKPTIKFSYNKAQSPVNFSYPKNQSPSKKPRVEPFIDFSIKEEIRLPKFLRKLRELTNYYPNFYSNKTFTTENVKQINQRLFSAFQQAKKAIKTLKRVHLRYHDLLKLIKELYNKLNRNVHEHKGEEDQELLEFFKENQWHNFSNYSDIDTIKPCDLFEKRVLNELEFMTLLNSYEQLLYEIEEEEILKIGDPKTVKTYMEFRDKLWAIEKNLRIMSEDFYLKAIIRIHLPQHVIDADRLIRQGKASSMEDKNRQLERLLFLQERRDVFASSWLGKYTVKLLLQE